MGSFIKFETIKFFIEKTWFYRMLELVVLGGELAVPFSRNPLKRGWIPSWGSYKWEAAMHFDRAPRNKRSRTSSGPGGSSDKWRSLCRGPTPVMSMPCYFYKDSTGGAQPFFLALELNCVYIRSALFTSERNRFWPVIGPEWALTSKFHQKACKIAWNPLHSIVKTLSTGSWHRL